ncbi:hypothetical protein [Vibrio paucivorans]|uniref:Uncharacterized protein n=1 Tax=Vibrio paucivorans TaxID=2829489 RepID=A0A9X3HPP3_9VIBR|nr:hypothetical protein [Vibrio paucivorans]MCW8332788.1 hypothetical protein [Vibrio paucivorans]
MFVLFSLLCSCVILALLFHHSKKRQVILKRKFDTLVQLRTLLQLCRDHRKVSHNALSSEVTDQCLRDTNSLYAKMIECSNSLIATVPFDNKPMYRIYQLKLKAMHDDWHTRSVSRNQIIHGKTIRHSMFLMDEIALAWLVDSERDGLSDEYHLNWQQVLDSMEVLTQLRLSIPDSDTPEGFMRLKHYCDKTRRKLNQLSIISPLSVASPASVDSIRQLTEVSSAMSLPLSTQEMYDVTSDISATISHVYDQMISEMSVSLYLPLPSIAYS